MRPRKMGWRRLPVIMEEPEDELTMMQEAEDDDDEEIRRKEDKKENINKQNTTEDEEEYEYEFDAAELEEAAPACKHLAVARYHSVQNFSPRAMFTDLMAAWGAADPMTALDLGDNERFLFLLEFGSEQTLRHVVAGGPWKHKGDAVVVVPYDGMTQLSTVRTDSVPLWVRIYDVPPAMLASERFVRALASKLGAVMEVGEAVRDFQRVRVEFPLADAIRPEVEIKVKGRGVMRFEVKYEDVPDFCLWCGRMGHAARDCPAEEEPAPEEDRSVRFGRDLRAPPFKSPKKARNSCPEEEPTPQEEGVRFGRNLRVPPCKSPKVS